MEDAKAMWEHTPGPWRVSDKNHDDLQHCARFANVVVYASNDCGIHPVADCSCNRTCRDMAECEANARLIAAAPDLLAALEAVEWGGTPERIIRGNGESLTLGTCPACECNEEEGHFSSCQLAAALKAAKGE